ncbi:MAG TPA: SGNH/GDSL hydrolase family protein [Bryobacteraceae bacterium]|nr:SGNH/GDSL hydrolase family protein [Bryobacteraceae bacterium]
MSGKTQHWLFALSLILVLSVTSNSAYAQDGDWIVTWCASPALAPAAQGLSPNPQTIRMVVHTSLGGAEVRVRISNVFGTNELRIDEAHIAQSTGGSRIDPATDRKLTFGGSLRVSVPPGAAVASDPVGMNAPELSDLAVTLFLPGVTERPTFHGLALRPTFIEPGNVSGAPDLPPGEQKDHFFFLTGVEVRPRRGPLQSFRPAAIVAFGDSITDGFRSTPETDHRWPNLLAQRLIRAQSPLAVVDAGISGNAILHGIIGPSGLSRFDRDVLDQAGVRYVIVLLGTNDVGHSQEPATAVTAADIIAAYRQLIERAHAKDLRIFAGTLPPFGGSIYNHDDATDSPTETMRQALNTFIRTSRAYDGYVDFDAALRNPEHPQEMLGQFDSGDHLHPNDAGYQKMADLVDPHLFGENPAPDAAARRAKMAWDALQKNFAVPNQPGVYNQDLIDTTPEFVWSHSQVMHAALDIGQLTGDYRDFRLATDSLSRFVAIRNGIFSYASEVNARPNAIRWWDDNGWVALALLQASEQIPDSPSLQLARKQWAFFKSGQAPQGGEWENETFVARGIPSGGTATEIALRLYLAANTSEDPRRTEYLGVARATDEFIESRLSRPGGLYWGGYYDDPAKSPFYDQATGRPCPVDRSSLPPAPVPLPPINVCVWMSLQTDGLMVGSDVLFYRATQDERYLDRAVRTANAALDHFPLEWMWKQPPTEVAVFFRNAFALDSVRPNSRYRAALEAYLEKAWNQARDPATGLFRLGDVAMSNRRQGISVLDQASFVQMFALLAWPREHLKDLN